MSLQSSPAPTYAAIGHQTLEQAKMACRIARDFEEAGKYESAEAALAEFWDGVGSEPRVNDLDKATAGDVLLRAGSITRRVSRSGLTGDVQELAKDLITRSLRIYEQLNLSEMMGEAQSELAYCYWRRGEYDNARVLLAEAIAKLPDSDVKAEAFLRAAVVEKSAGNARAALEVLERARWLFERSASRVLRGRFHLERATFLKNLGEAADDEALTDTALLEYAAAAFHFGEAGHERNLGLVENQTGYLLLKKKRFDDAHYHLERARNIFNDLEDRFRVAQVDDTRAQAFIEEGNFAEAIKSASAAVAILDASDTYALHVEALTTLATAQARNGNTTLARENFLRAIEVARRTGDGNIVIDSIVATINEMQPDADYEEMLELYLEADELLSFSYTERAAARLNRCAATLLKARISSGVSAEHSSGSLPAKVTWEGFSLKKSLRGVEAEYIKRALHEAQGSVSKAAMLLGFRHSESLNCRIKNLGLLSERTPIKPRKRSIIPKEFQRQPRKRGSKKSALEN